MQVRTVPTLHRRPLSLAIAAALIGAANPAFAVDEPTAQGNQVDTITVSATRRPESLQKVPVAVTVLRGDDLAKDNRNNVASIVEETPSVNFRTGASNKDTSLFIRGVGTISTSPGVEPSVSTVVDGVVYARPGQATLDLLDIDRIEILRGPQGTLFGKNASAGVINIVTKDPAQLPEAYVDASYFGGGNERRLRAGWSGALSNEVSASITGLIGKYDGNVKNIYLGTTVNGYDDKGARAKVVFKPSSDLKFTVAADYIRNTSTVPTGVITATQLIAYPSGAVTQYPAFANGLAPVVAGPQNRLVNSNLDSRAEDKNGGVSGQVDWGLGGYTLTAISAYRKWDNEQFQDASHLYQPFVGIPQSHDHGQLSFKQVSEEIRIASPKGRLVDYVAGVYYLNGKDDETYRRDVQRTTNNAIITNDFGVANYGTKNTSYAVFGEGTLNFTSSLRTIAGLRWTDESLDYHHQRTSTEATAFPGVNPAVANTGSTHDHALSGRIGPQFDINEHVSAYATYSHGYKGPAYNVFFNMQNRDTLALKPETSDGYELGLKSTLLNNRLRLNLAAFHTDYDNFQANFADLVQGTVVTRLINAGKISTQGIEADFAAKPISNFTLTGGVANIRARIDQFNCPVGAPISCNVNGKPLPFSPDWKAYAQGSYRVALSNGLQLEPEVDTRWQSSVQYDIGQFPDTIQGPFAIWNTSVALSDPSRGWRVTILAKNLGNKSYAPFLSRGGSFLQRWVPRDDQRYYGVNLHYDF
ncbi:MAG: TonB-dependent receptor [Burkholderiales bacterium]|nr:TonB-dependent receptor [Burkholderiales bacterium]